MTTPSTSSSLVDLQRLVVAIRRKRRLWLAMALIGLIAGAALAVVLPNPPTAVTKILVIHKDDSPTDSGTLMKTDISVLQTTKIADAALKTVGSNEKPEDFLKEYQGLGLTNNVMQISVEAKSGSDAVAKAKALADVFIADHVQRNQAAADAESAALINQRNQAQAQLADVDNQIATLTNKGARANATDLESLYGRRADLSSKITDLNSQAQQAGIGSPNIAAGTQIVDAPRLMPNALLKTTATNAGVGLALGLAIGLTLAAVTAVVRDRPVLRRELAANLGASVIAQLPPRRRGLARLVWRSRATSNRKRVAATLARAIRTGSGTVSLLDLGAPRVTGALALDVATELSADGPVTLIDDLPGSVAPAADGDGAVQIIDPAETSLPVQSGRVLGAGSVAPGAAWTDLSHLGTETILVVRTGYANTTWLHTVARQLADCQIGVIGIVVVDPDPRDRTDGTLWDGLHMALRGRLPHATADENTKAFTPVKSNGRDAAPHNGESPTRRFAPVRSEDVEVS
ncbi:exopolysaccharide biosynthesis protein [Amycolatopsis sp. K13G38]|uniref:Exopolysaccharide biosynthesis protein n=1 Tax=Amycolatopsis acididurans TaxID=2724524 RepID=A0ABX1J7I2_9PSEU|nr:Wzz/FepE/Etk N-terminal domain-containing protein [Amycolatopsis acididurans]NKQ55758.1 exopolysaccharide biosynthesis protein [Amycolatopsis acididurans]